MSQNENSIIGLKKKSHRKAVLRKKGRGTPPIMPQVIPEAKVQIICI
jgi:hypothetical protein